MGDPDLFVFPAQFPFFLLVFFSLALCVWLRGLYPHFLHILFVLNLFVPLMRQLNLSYSVNLSCSFAGLSFSLWPIPSSLLSPLFANSRRSLSHSHQPPSLPWLYPSLSAISLVRGHFAAPVFQSPLLALGSEWTRPVCAAGEAVCEQTSAHACPRCHKGAFLLPINGFH